MELVLTQNDDLLVATTSPPLTIGVISDTHVSARARALPAAVLDRLSGSDIILHAGDLVELSVLATLQAIAPVLAVAGNCDGAEVVKELPNRLLLRVGRWHIGTGRAARRSIGPGIPSQAPRSMSSFLDIVTSQ